MTTNIRKMIIIWSGPAGHTAAIYAWRAQLEPLMFEWWMAWWVAAWWQLTTTTEVENYPWFPTGIGWTELMMSMREQSVNSWTEIKSETVTAVKLSDNPSETPHEVHVGDEVYYAYTVVIATWATAKKLIKPGVEEFWNRWISGCAVCDGALPVFKDKELVVIGWWDVAMEEAIFLTKYGSHVHVLMRSNNFKSSKIMEERAKAHPQITFHYFTELVEAHGSNVLESLTVLNNQTNEQSTLTAGGLFFAIWHTPNTKFLEWQITTDDTGYIITTPWTASTNMPGVYAWWDVQDNIYRQAVTSAWTWCMAALEAEHFLQSIGK